MHTSIASSDVSDHEWINAPCTITSHANYLCQINASDHQWGTFACGDETHVGYLCQVSSDHKTVINGFNGSFYECQPHTTGTCGHIYQISNASTHTLQSSCSTTNSNGDSCTVTNFYTCQPHTHRYPVTCGNTLTGPQTCDGGAVTSSTQHRLTCTHGHLYWGCNAWHRHYHTERTCTACGVRYYRCLQEACIAGGLHKW